MEKSPRHQRRTRDWFTDITCHTQGYPAHMPGKPRCGRQGSWVGRGEGGPDERTVPRCACHTVCPGAGGLSSVGLDTSSWTNAPGPVLVRTMRTVPGARQRWVTDLVIHLFSKTLYDTKQCPGGHAGSHGVTLSRRAWPSPDADSGTRRRRARARGKRTRSMRMGRQPRCRPACRRRAAHFPAAARGRLRILTRVDEGGQERERQDGVGAFGRWRRSGLGKTQDGTTALIPT